MEDFTGIPLSPSIAVQHLDAVINPGKVYSRKNLVDTVKGRHVEKGGVVGTANVTGQVKKALQTLVSNGVLDNPRTGHYRKLTGSTTNSATDVETPEAQPEQPAEEEESQSTTHLTSLPAAEVTLGNGSECVYGWYLPSYRELARLQEERHFPIKVGRTTRNPYDRVNESAGMLPEKPVIGFLLRVDGSELWERFLHAKLALRGRSRVDANGSEWFDTNLDELRHMVEMELADVNSTAT